MSDSHPDFRQIVYSELIKSPDVYRLSDDDIARWRDGGRGLPPVAATVTLDAMRRVYQLGRDHGQRDMMSIDDQIKADEVAAKQA